SGGGGSDSTCFISFPLESASDPPMAVSASAALAHKRPTTPVTLFMAWCVVKNRGSVKCNLPQLRLVEGIPMLGLGFTAVPRGLLKQKITFALAHSDH
ncbi:MAG: hypothetical protein JWO45_1977, partial [Spartobacteria bacterium]|nr:hypothetical protein [Spartobacteria bacterium]